MKLRGWFVIVFFFLAAGQLFAVSEEFHKTYAVGDHVRIRLKNVNGDVEIVAGQSKEVKLDAVKSAEDDERLREARIDVDADSGSISIETHYDRTEWHNENPASVDYRLTVPRDANLEDIDLVNGQLTISAVQGKVSASCVNGALEASGLTDEAKLSTVNGKLEVAFNDMVNVHSIDLSSVNGSILLRIPDPANVRFHASSLSGGIHNDFGFSEDGHGWIGHTLSGTLGNGKTDISVSNVNGSINLRRL